MVEYNLEYEQSEQNYNLNYDQVVQEVERDYNNLDNKPKINNVELQGNKSASDLGITTKTYVDTQDEATLQSAKDYIDDELEDYVPKEENKGLSTNDYTNEDKSKVQTAVQPSAISDMATKTWVNAQNFITNAVNNLINYFTKTEVNNLLNGKVDKETNKSLMSAEEHTKLSGIEDGATKVEKTSDIENDSGFITKLANDLVNYYLKTETYTKLEVNNLISAIKQFEYLLVDTLPTASAETMHKIYLVPSQSSGTQNVKDEYITIIKDGAYIWEAIGKTEIDLSNYYTKGEVNTLLNAKVDITTLANYSTTAEMNTAINEHHDSTKQDTISDLDTIRSGATLGATAVQPSAISDMATKTWVGLQGFITNAVNNLVNYFTKTEVNGLLNGKVDKVTGKGLSENDFTSTLKSKLDGISANAKNVSVSATGTATDEVQYITIDGVEKKIKSGGSGVTLTVTLNKYDGETVNTTFTFTNLTTQESETYNYNGQPVNIECEKNISYKIEFTILSGYSTPDTYQAIATQSASLTFTYGVYLVYGIERTLTSTSDSWIRTDSSIGLTARATHDGNAVTNDFDGIYPWRDIKTVNYNVSTDQVVAEIGDDNFKFDGTNGEVMTYIPPFYLKRWQDSTKEYIQISGNNFEGATRIDGFYIGRYTIASDGTHSKSGVTSKVSQTISIFRSQCAQLGNGWSQLDWHYFVIEDLYLVEYALGNSQTALGNGICSDSAQHTLGELDSLGMKSGCLVDDNKHAVIYRGIENPFGNIWQFVDGINIQDRVAYICYDPSQYANDVFEAPYVQMGYTNSTSNGTPNRMGYDSNNQIIALPTAVGTSVYGDYYWQNTGNRIAFVGGGWGDGSADGFFYWYCSNDSSGSYGTIGARLLKISV